MYEMIWKNKKAEDFDLFVLDLGRRQRAEEKLEIIEIPNRNDDLITHTGKYKTYIREMEFALIHKGYYDYSTLDKINQWLTGRDKLMTSLDEDGYFMASVVSGLPYEKLMNGVNHFKVSFRCDPFFYLWGGDSKTNITKATRLYNNGTIYSEPLITIFGTGNIVLNIGSQFVQFNNVVDSITIDTALQICYRGIVNEGGKMIGEFPVLNVGENPISWTGNVIKLEITGRMRNL